MGWRLKSEADRHESRIQFNEERLRELASQNEKALPDINCHYVLRAQAWNWIR